jgi:hypothetical protein
VVPVKKIGIILAAAIFLASCGFSGYDLEPSFLRYPFEELFIYELESEESGNEVLFIPESTIEEGVLIYDYVDDGSELNSTYSAFIWNGTDTSSISTAFGVEYLCSDFFRGYVYV